MSTKAFKTGRVFLIGAGPGDPDLITLKGFSLLNSCDVVVYDNLIPHELIVTLPPQVEKIYVGKISDQHTLPQEEINQLLVELASDGKNVARLKGGDPFVFGRGGEEAEFLREHDIEFEVVPGITAGLAGAATAGIPASHRDLSSAILLLTAHGAVSHEFFVDWKWVAGIKQGTIIGYMGVKQLSKVVSKLIQNGLSPDTEAAMIERCCFSTQKIVRAKLSALPQAADENNIKPPAIFIIGNVSALAEKLRWYDRKVLSGIRILVTRPADQSRWVYQMLRGLGAEVQAFPTIKTAFVADQTGWEKFATAGGENSWLVFTSENGVRYFFGYLKSKQIDLRVVARYRIAATGYGTLRSLTALGYIPDYCPSLSGTAAFAEKMCDDLDIESARVVRVRGRLPSDPVTQILERGGAEVYPLDVYKTISEKWNEPEIKRLMAYPPHVIMFTSGRAVDGLFDILGEEQASKLMSQATLATIGPTTSRELTKYGLKVEIEASRHSIPDLIEQVSQYYLKAE